MERPEAFSGRVQEQLSLLRKSPGLHWNHFRSLTEMSQVNRYYQFLLCFSSRYADIYAASVLNMLYYPTFYMFRGESCLNQFV